MNLRRVRRGGAWLLALPFLWLSRPTWASLAWGAPVALAGLLLRGWAAGHIRKDEALTTTGPFAHLRNPLFAGSFLVGGGIAVSGGHFLWPSIFIGFYLAAYVPAVREETDVLARLFGDAYRAYAARVPAWLPRLTPYRPEREADEPTGAAAPTPSDGFSRVRYRRNREWEALLGGLAALGVLALKTWLAGR